MIGDELVGESSGVSLHCGESGRDEEGEERKESDEQHVVFEGSEESVGGSGLEDGGGE